MFDFSNLFHSFESYSVRLDCHILYVISQQWVESHLKKLKVIQTKKRYWQEELISIATEPEGRKELEDKDEIDVLAHAGSRQSITKNTEMTSRSGRQGNDIKEEEEEAILKSHILIMLSRHNKSCPAFAYCSIAFPPKL